MENVLIIAPHPDDEILGCGGVITKYIAAGKKVFIIVSTNASVGAPDLYNELDVNLTRQEAIAAHNFLGVHETIFLDYPAPNLKNAEQFRISMDLSGIIKRVRPEVVFLPHPSDLHSDHSVIYESALVALRPFSASSVKQIYCYETLSETEWAPYQGINPFHPNVFVDISVEIDAKLKAMEFFKSQLKEFPHPRSIEALTALAKLRGSTINSPSAEAFELVRAIM